VPVARQDLLTAGRIAELDDVAGPLEATVTTVPKPNRVKQEADKLHELVRSALRAVAALSHLADDGAVPARPFLFPQCL
jgi:hypothetical protein